MTCHMASLISMKVQISKLKKKIKIILNKKTFILLSKMIKVLLNKKIIIFLPKMFKISLNMKIKTILTTMFMSHSTQLFIMRLMKITLQDNSYDDIFLYVCHSSRSYDEKIRLIHLKIKSHLPLNMEQTFFDPIFL
jgi:hypothetical protein